MREFFRSKFFIVIVIVTLILVIVPSTLSAMGLSLHVRNAVNVILTPVQKLFSACTDAVDGFTSYFTEFDRISDENRELKNTLAGLTDEVARARQTQNTNEWLEKYLELKREHIDFKMESANVTGRESGNYMTVFTLDRGSSHGVEAGMPVITEAGIVGYITEAGTDWSKAVTLLESGTSIGAYIERTEEVGVVEGDFTLAGDGLCRMLYLSADSTVAEGDRVMSTGFGSVYPHGLVIGSVVSVEPDPYSQSLIATIKPAAELSDISKLMVIKSYESYSE